jgi:catechol 2,3-dioxygenase-like lactoylglutathione lyase family enzyme
VSEGEGRRDAAVPPLTGVLETALYVADLDRSAGFYTRLLGARVLLADERMRAVDVAGRQLLLLFLAGASDRPNPVPGGVVPPHDGGGRLHLAFAVPADALPRWEARLAELSLAVESRVHAERGGTSLYFRDPDGHLLELATPGLWETY